MFRWQWWDSLAKATWESKTHTRINSSQRMGQCLNHRFRPVRRHKLFHVTPIIAQINPDAGQYYTIQTESESERVVKSPENDNKPSYSAALESHSAIGFSRALQHLNFELTISTQAYHPCRWSHVPENGKTVARNCSWSTRLWDLPWKKQIAKIACSRRQNSSILWSATCWSNFASRNPYLKRLTSKGHSW